MVLFTLFVVAIVLGQLVARIRAQEQAERRREQRAAALYEFTRELAEVSSRDQVVWHLVAQIDRVFQAPVAVMLPLDGRLAAHPDGSWVSEGVGGGGLGARQRKAAGRRTTCPARKPPAATTERKGWRAGGPPARSASGPAQRDRSRPRAAGADLDRSSAGGETGPVAGEPERFSRTRE
jgi:hypothetical protein